MTKIVLGHIDCPTCAASNGMRITHDKNGHPFGFCETQCGQQLRIGGDLRRVAAFVARFPWAGIPVTGTVAVTAPEKLETPVAVAAPVAAPAAKPAAKAPPKPPSPTATPWFSTLLGGPANA